MMQASDRAVSNAHAAPCAKVGPTAAGGRGRSVQPTTVAATVGPCCKPFAAPRPVSKARGFDPSSLGKGPAHAAQESDSQGRPSGLQPAAEDNMRQLDRAGTVCRGRNELQQLGSSSTREQQALAAEITENAMQRDASSAGTCRTDREPVISDSWEDSDSNEHNDVSHLQGVSSEQQVSRAASQHMLLSQETGEDSSHAGSQRQQCASHCNTAQESAKPGASGKGLAAQEGGSGELTGRKRLKRLYNAPISLDASADTGSGNSTEVRRTWRALHCGRHSACVSLCQT